MLCWSERMIRSGPAHTTRSALLTHYPSKWMQIFIKPVGGAVSDSTFYMAQSRIIGLDSVSLSELEFKYVF